jgi:lipopolysaccharide export system protein LptC
VTSLWRVGWDRLSLYLPIVLMGVLALGTYWLVRSTPQFAPPEAPRAPTHEPDYYMKKFSVRAFDVSGNLKSEVTGVEAKHYPDTDLLEIDIARMRSLNDLGQLTVATSNRAITNADGSEVKLIGNALVVREAGSGKPDAPRLEFRGEFLHAFLKTERVWSDKPVTLIRGRDKFVADSLEFDNISQVLELRGRVRGTLVPEQRR